MDMPELRLEKKNIEGKELLMRIRSYIMAGKMVNVSIQDWLE